MSQPPPVRLFVALHLPNDWRAYLADRARDLERLVPGYARWVAPELMHLTVVFLGEQPVELLPSVEEAIAAGAARSEPFMLALGRLGHFGGSVPRVLWMDVRGSGPDLERLHAALSVQLDARQLEFDRKPLVAHLTLGRAHRDATPSAGRALAQRLPTLTLPPIPGSFRFGSVALLRSDLSPRGPQYTTLREFPLGGPPE